MENLVTQFEEANPEGNVIIFSDHGMVNVDHGVNVNFEQVLGPSTPQTYLYFIDSATMRIWIYDEELKPKMEKCLQDLGCGTILSQEQRVRWGATERYCGDIVFVLNEGDVFAPSFFGLKKAAAMHGYLPDQESQQAIFLAKGNSVESVTFDQVNSTQHLYAYLLELGCGVSEQ